MTSGDDDGIRHALLQLLEANPPDEEKLLARFESRRKDGEAVYSAILSILTHLSFSETEAERHWRRIRRHRESLRKDIHRDVGLRVALLDYFVNVSRELKNPKIIEISIYESTARSAVTDGLTGVFNHAYFLSALRRETQRSKRYGLKLSLAMLDLDDFKHLNDTHGHLAGDEVLVKAASLMTQSLREVDIAARYGGEEFALILPDTPRMGAFVVADRIRKRVDEHFRRRKGGPVVTMSGGVATFPDDAADLEQLIKRADEGLYRSKSNGKNRVTVIGGERRAHHRVTVTHRVTVAADGHTAAAARAKNLSEGGLLVSFARSVPVGSPLDLTLRPRGGVPVGIRGEVVRVEAHGTQGRVLYDLGLRFLAEPGGPPLPLLRRLISDV
jgi:two-component system cell cycle response regulator